MLDKQNQGPQCTGCGNPMRLAAIEPSMWRQDLRTFACPQCKSVQRHIIESAVTEAWGGAQEVRPPKLAASLIISCRSAPAAKRLQPAHGVWN